MASVEDFLRAPSEELLERCSREQLLKIAEHFKLEVGDKRMKENIKAIVKAYLTELGVVRPKLQATGPEKLAVEKLAREAEIKRLEVEERRLSLSASAPCMDRPFKLHVDASDVGAGAVLFQCDDSGVERP
eukprot:superscaffoldBa00016751_g26939